MNDPSERTGTSPTLRVDRDRVPEAVDVLCDAFADYPVMRYVLGERDEGYPGRLRTLIHFFVMARVLRDEPILGLADGERLGAAATISIPGTTSPAELGTLRESVWAELGSAARARYERFGEAASAFTVDAPHIHLNMIGVRRSLQGTGLGRRMLEAVHRFSREHPRSDGVTLDTDAANVGMYERFGYERIGHARVSPELEIWGFFRRDGHE